ncbi:FeoB-associated Cys-rich membrane protein [Clostridium boliviensis]|uniref:FeoB-associated Cys-rich membrane protein n=1 Tax=Clostridium boliviensis TaxID=318465 RepID=A0ABU4GN88_9CLOT|nr:FeoB-associated Cys-rich membrane protein [Clostridium boliviensis]MDW2799081.1 FeoB-associated Cys-rich membrane protein [Clostridium boliviensis]
MSVWLIKNWATIVILVIILVLVFLAVRSVLKNRGGCGSGGCENCAGCGAGRKSRGKNKD